MALTAPQTRTIALRPSEAGAALAFDRFDPSLGALTGVDIRVTARMTSSTSFENMDLAARSLSTTASATVSVLVAPHGLGLVAQMSDSVTATLGAFDGTADFAGGSGAAGLLLDGSATVAELLTESRLLGEFVGAGTTRLSVSAGYDQISTLGGGNLRQSYAAGSEAEVTVSYRYVPIEPPGSTSGAVTTWAGDFTWPGVVIRAWDLDGLVPRSTPARPMVTTPAQVFAAPERATGWQDALSVAQFDPALGSLRAVNLRLAGTLSASVAVEGNSGVSVRQSATLAVTPAGGGVALASVTLAAPDRGFDAAPGFRQAASQGTVLADPAAVAPFVGTGTLGLAFDGLGVSSFTGAIDVLLAELRAAAGGRLEVSYTYEPGAPVLPLAMTNVSSGSSGAPVSLDYAGPVAGVLREYAAITPDNIALSTGTDSWYLRTGDGDDAIQVTGGVNVLDGGGGSNYLVGGAGQDTFFVDGRAGAAPVWSSIANMGSGDAVTVWGISSLFHTLSWGDGQGAGTSVGLTLHAQRAGAAPVLVTLVGYASADLGNGRLSVAYGNADGIPYFHIAAA